MNRLVKISDGVIEVGVLPDLGGMVALLRIIGKPNVLKADPALWDEAPVIRRRFGPDPRWKAYNGHIVWVGPQSEWWLHQSKSPKKRRERAVWPPDPYINNGYFEVIERSATELVMRGPDSEFSGVRLTKSVKIKDGRVLFTVSALNVRDEPISWDLWLNTRVDGYARCYAPVASMKGVRIDGRETESSDVGVYSHDQGYCRVESCAPSRNKKERWAKAFIPASRGAMAAFVSSQALIIRFKRHAPKLIHPEQALVEFYNYTSTRPYDALTELEYHAPYRTLAPGESMKASQQWELYPFRARPGHQACIDFLRDMGV
jgi:hypothetical protein